MPSPDNWSDEAKRMRRIVDTTFHHRKRDVELEDKEFRTEYYRARGEEADATRPDPVLPDAPISGDPVVDLGMVDCE